MTNLLPSVGAREVPGHHRQLRRAGPNRVEIGIGLAGQLGFLGFK